MQYTQLRGMVCFSTLDRMLPEITKSHASSPIRASGVAGDARCKAESSQTDAKGDSFHLPWIGKKQGAVRSEMVRLADWSGRLKWQGLLRRLRVRTELASRWRLELASQPHLFLLFPHSYVGTAHAQVHRRRRLGVRGFAAPSGSVA